MKARFPFVARVSLCLLACLSLTAAALADKSHDRTQFGHDITVNAGDEISEVTCFGCSVRVRGHVDGDVTTFGGSIVLEEEGEVGGDATSFGGGVRLDAGAKVDGDTTVFGGHLRRDPLSTVGGDVTNFGGSFWLILIFGLPFAILGAFIALVVWIVRLLTRPTAPSVATPAIR
jgi:large exoprotein involved in heme utilization and adhesion